MQQIEASLYRVKTGKEETLILAKSYKAVVRYVDLVFKLVTMHDLTITRVENDFRVVIDYSQLSDQFPVHSRLFTARVYEKDMDDEYKILSNSLDHILTLENDTIEELGLYCEDAVILEDCKSGVLNEKEEDH